MKNKFVDTLLFLDEFQLKDSGEKQSFFLKLKDSLDMFPDDVAKYKILPKLIHVRLHFLYCFMYVLDVRVRRCGFPYPDSDVQVGTSSRRRRIPTSNCALPREALRFTGSNDACEVVGEDRRVCATFEATNHQ